MFNGDRANEVDVVLSSEGITIAHYNMVTHSNGHC